MVQFLVGVRVGTVSAVMGVAMLAGSASADLAGALDRAPKGAAVTVGIRNIEHVRSEVEALIKKFEPEAAEGMHELDKLFDAEGFNKNGSAAFVMMGDPTKDDFSPENAVVILPVSDWAKFTKAMGGEEGKKETNLPELDGSILARDLGGGFFVMGPEPAVQAYKDATGQTAEHKALLGGTGVRVADGADVVAFLSVQMFKSQIEEMIEQGKNQAEMAASMMGGGNPDAEKNIQAMVKGFETAAKDAQSLVMGLTMAKGGVSMDFAVHFKEGSESGKKFTHEGGLGGIVGTLPKMPFLTAFAFDMTHPVLKNLVLEATKASAAGMGGMGGMVAGQVEKIDAMAFVLGSNPALLSTGLFAKAMTFEKTSDPAGVLAGKREALGKMSMDKDGVKVEATLTPDAVEIAGQKVDRLKTKIEISPDSPLAQAQQFLTLFTGTSGEMGGMMTKTKGGVLTTMSANTELMTKAIQAQNGDGALSTDADFAAVVAMLPPNRAFEGYLGVKGVADTAAGVMQLFGMPMPVEIKEEMPPIALGVTAGTGGIGARLVFPTKVIDTFADVAKKMKQMQEAPAGDQPEEKPEEKAGERRKPRL